MLPFGILLLITFHNANLPVLPAASLCSADAVTVFNPENVLCLGYYTSRNGEEDQRVLLRGFRLCHGTDVLRLWEGAGS